MTAPTTRETADHAELAACPFCGGDPFDCGFRRWECGLCGAKGPAGRKNDATSGWNSRAGEAALLSEIAALRGDLTVSRDDLDQLQAHFRQRDREATQAERQRDEAVGLLRELADGRSQKNNINEYDDLSVRASTLLANQGADQ